MENTENTENNSTPTPEPTPKKNYGAMLLTICIVAAVIYFGGNYLYKLVKPTSSADSSLVNISAVDSLAKDSIPFVTDTVKTYVDTTKKSVVDTTKKK